MADRHTAKLCDWLSVIEEELKRVRSTRLYGSLRVEYQNGQITRVVQERSVRDPVDLAPEPGACTEDS